MIRHKVKIVVFGDSRIHSRVPAVRDNTAAQTVARVDTDPIKIITVRISRLRHGRARA